jgi:hypothetical protein
VSTVGLLFYEVRVVMWASQSLVHLPLVGFPWAFRNPFVHHSVGSFLKYNPVWP